MFKIKNGRFGIDINFEANTMNIGNMKKYKIFLCSSINPKFLLIDMVLNQERGKIYMAGGFNI